MPLSTFLPTLLAQKEALEAAMQSAVEAESFEEASRLQELLDDVDDAIDAAQAEE